jgi:SAM-dependent methyltransferase
VCLTGLLQCLTRMCQVQVQHPASVCATCRFGRHVLDTAVRWTGDLLRHVYGKRAQDLSILDVGCGNGTMLVGLAAQGFANLAGQDYSDNAIELARQVLRHHDLTHISLRVSGCCRKAALHPCARHIYLCNCWVIMFASALRSSSDQGHLLLPQVVCCSKRTC